MIVIKVLVWGITISGFSVYSPQCGLDNNQKDVLWKPYQCIQKVRGQGNCSYGRRFE